MAIYSFIVEEQAEPECPWSITEMCKVLEVSRSGFYDWQSRQPSDRELGLDAPGCGMTVAAASTKKAS